MGVMKYINSLMAYVQGELDWWLQIELSVLESKSGPGQVWNTTSVD